jgi:IclR family transcriptional regulator, pca regulon regulatory protein
MSRPVRKADGKEPRRSHSSARISPTPDPRMSRSLEYGAAILECFSHDYQVLGIAELADMVGIGRSTTHRYAITLVALGYLEQDPKRRYRLSIQAGGPGRAAIGAIRRQVPARFALEELRSETGHTVSMGVLDRTLVIYVHRLFGHRCGQYIIDMDLGVGATVPVYCTALGRILLASVSAAERRELLVGLQLIPHGPNSILSKVKLAAELDRMNVREPVVSDEELTAGSRSIAVLVPRPATEYPLAIEVTVPSSAYTVERLIQGVGPQLRRTAELISGE